MLRNETHRAGVPPLLPVLAGPKRNMYRVVQASGMREAMEALTAVCPEIIHANIRLAGYLPPAVRHPYLDVPLFTSCLREAVRAGFGPGTVPSPRQYFSAMIERAAMVLRYDFEEAGSRWHPLYDAPLSEWMKQPRRVEVKASGANNARLPIATFVEGMYHRLLPAESVGKLRPHHLEEPAFA